MGVAIALTRTGHILRARERKRSEEDGMTNAIVTSKLSNFEKPTTKRDVDKLPKRRWHCCNPCHPQKIVRFLLEDWLFLAVLGVLMAFLSLAVDACIDQLQTFHMYLMNKVERADDDLLNFALTYIVWMAYTMVVMLASVVFVHYVGPQAIGSGIPEMKTILRGVRLKECLSFRTLMAKMGPFVHVGSIVANLISRLVRNFKPAYANESRSCEMLAAGCAAGVACTFSAPIGGVLFSIEVTAVYFAVRDYWRGFFAAACGSAIFSLLRLYTHSSEVTVVAFYQTTFKNRAFYPEELFIFALIGRFCSWIVYPIVISAIYATLTHPIGFGRYITGEVVFSHTLKDFFMNCTWSAHPSKFETCAGSVAARWSADESIFAELVVFVVGFYFLSIVASTLPVPAGIFMPVFVIGAGMGRLFGEIVAHNFPDGLRGDRQMLVYPGIYAVVGASSFCGAVTHTVSVAVIAFELTGQLLHILPVMSVRKLCLQPIFMLQIAVIIANITCSSFQPSFFDSIIKIKHLPYLPDIPKSTSEVHSIRAEQIMITNVKFLSKKSTYRELQDLLISLPRLRAFPIVDDPETKILLGSVSRATLLQLLDAQVGEAARRAEAAKRINEERELLASLQPSREEIKLKKPMFSIGTPDAARKTAVENFVATHAESAAVDRFRVLPVHSHDRCESRKTKGIGTTSRPQLDRSISETNTRKLATTTTAPSESQLKTASSAGDMLVGTKQLSPHHRKLLTVHSAHDFYVTLGGMLRNFTHTFRHSKKRRINSDLMAHERHEWERKQLACIVDFGSAIIDPAPFQLVEDTSLYKVHSIFSLLGIRRAYVTKCGVLVGVVALRDVREDLRSAIERTQWGELDSKTERVEEVMELPVVSSKRRASSHSEGHQTDLDSDTDDEDCILIALLQPRVEVEETTPSTCELEQRLPMAVTSSDISDQYVAGDADLSAGPLTPTSSTEENGAAACHLPLKLESYLEAYGGKSSGQQPSAPIPMHTAGSAKLPGCARHVLIVEPEHSTQMVKTNTERNSDGKGIAGATSCHRQPCRKYECGSRSKIVPKHFKSHQEKSVSSIGNSNDGDVRQSSMAEKCSMWIDDDDDVLSDSPVRSGKVFDEESTSAISSSLCGERQSSTTSGSNIATGRLGMDPDPLIACHPTQRSISDVVRPRLISEERVWSRRSPVNAEPQTPLSSTAKSPKQNGHELTTDDDL
ncbi:unnamed protein product [Toxocara canis]|uniref:Chloride channel protein n=1 Tax=Toxocara canis TaxID=6265 RepID=A0A183TW34_TOXCA|nr:unnamed protein product [Toxocara canis]